ncbi:ABC transporter permease subunit [Pseudoclostridium thermosuccinogenes]|uniref:ABC transporter permease n=1 Tax=Clostridium thermosuccinogenes TaxID=84032 RepID=UPI001FA8658D|nr:ABC transporter permease subunit [Pseudoclostridium thermosuccinogenes]
MNRVKKAAVPRRKRFNPGYFRKRVMECRYLYAMFLLPLAFYIIFCYVPMYGVTIAFKKYDIMKGILGSPWVGTRYFKEFLTDPYFWKVFKNTLLLNIYNIIFSFPAPIILALLFNELKNEKFKKFTQSVSYLPHFISTVIICGMITNFFATDGPVNNLLAMLGIERIQFLMKAEWFRPIYIGSGIWQGIGWGSIIYLAALAGVDTQLYEAALIDGAGRWKMMTHITLPSILPTITIMLILSIGNIMSVGFEKILLLYNGSTYETADVIATYVYRRGLLGSDFSYATAVGLFQSVVGLIFISGANFISKKLSETSLW